MEQKRTLWIIAAAGIFLLVVLGAALILYSPSAHTAQTVAAVTPVNRPASSGWVSAPAAGQQEEAGVPETASVPAGQAQAETSQPTATADASRQTVAKVGDMTVIADNATVYGLEKKYPENTASDGSTTIDLNTLKTQAPAESVTPQNEAGAKAIENVRQNSHETQDDSTSYTEPARKQTAKPAARQVTAAKKAPKAAPARKQTAPAAKKAAKKPSVTQFWVQAAAFTSRTSADNARTTLDNNKIPADVFTYKDNKGRMFYRVRIGPYMTKSEAEYWRTRIVQIDEFSKTESYVTATSSASY